MSAAENRNDSTNGDVPQHEPFVPPEQTPPEFTWPAVLTGAILGIIFGASSLYLLLKVGMTVSASVPIAVLSITLFRVFSKTFGIRKTTILENNIVQTTGSAGESIAFGVGVTMPALLLLGFEMDPIRVLTVSVLGGLLGILMMIPLRRAFIVKQHGKLKYPEGTACAEVLVAGEKGGATAKMVFVGFGIAAVYTFLMKACKFWNEAPTQKLYDTDADGKTTGLKGSQASIDASPELLGVGFLIGPRVACFMMAGAVLSYFVLGPMVATFGEHSPEPIAPAGWNDQQMAPRDAVVGGAGGLAWSQKHDSGLIRNMEPKQLRSNYLLFIGAGAVAAGGIISMMRAMPLIIGSIKGGIRDLRASRRGEVSALRTDRDMSMNTVLFGSIGLVLIIAAVPQLGLGFSFLGILGALMILIFGFLFVTVSSRLTGEVGSSSNPISGMTIATLLLVCLIFFVLDKRDISAMLTALTVAAVVCIASSNGGTTSQDLKTGYLVGATPKKQQWAILVGALASAVVIAGTMLLLNVARTHYTSKNLPEQTLKIPADAPREKVGRPHDKDDQNEYSVVHVRKNDELNPDVKDGRYLVDGEGRIKYRTDTPIDQRSPVMDNGDKAPQAYDAPQPQLFVNIIRGILTGDLEWGLVIIGVLIAIALELMGLPALPVAVGMYISLASTTPIFIGGLLRWVADKWSRKSASESEAETSPGVLLASGYIAGGTLCGLIIGFSYFLPDSVRKSLEIGTTLLGEKVIFGEVWDVEKGTNPKILAMLMYGLLAAMLVRVAIKRSVNGNNTERIE
jgi:uncharacterized oligopeptide transporter (OPT) family protein